MGREENCKQISLSFVGSTRSISATLGLTPLTACVLSRSYFLGSRLLCQGTEAGPGFRALRWSKLIRFRFLSTPQRRRLGWAYVLCPSQVWAAQGTRYLVSAVFPGGWCILSPPRSQLLHFLGGSGCAVGADLWLRPSGQMSTAQNPKKSWLATGGLLAVW